MAKTQAVAKETQAPEPAGPIQPQRQEPEKPASPSRFSHDTTSPLPPPSRNPPSARAAELLTHAAGSLGTLQRARMMSGLQHQIGNARISRMLGPGVQAKLEARASSLGPAIQRKLTFGRPDDRYEREAEATADRVVHSLPVAGVSKLSSGRLPTQRQEISPDEELKEPPPTRVAGEAGIQQKEKAQTERALRSHAERESLAARAIASRGGGEPLVPTVQHRLERSMDVDLSNVRVHRDGGSQEAAAALGARAFTHKNDIWLGPGESPTDLRLMAHESTHVLQQGGAARRKLRSDQDRAESQGPGSTQAASIQAQTAVALPAEDEEEKAESAPTGTFETTPGPDRPQSLRGLAEPADHGGADGGLTAATTTAAGSEGVGDSAEGEGIRGATGIRAPTLEAGAAALPAEEIPTVEAPPSGQPVTRTEAPTPITAGAEPPEAQAPAPATAGAAVSSATDPLATEIRSGTEGLAEVALEAGGGGTESSEETSAVAPVVPELQFDLLSDIRQGLSRALEWVADNIVGPIRRIAASGWRAIKGFGARISQAYRQANASGWDILQPEYLIFRTMRNLRRSLYREAIDEQRRRRARSPERGAPGPAEGTEPTLLETVDSVANTIEGAAESVFEVNREVLEGAILGDFKENPSVWNTIGQIAIGFVPYAGQVADVRDLVASIKKLSEGGWRNPWEWFNLVLVGVGFIPGFGDAIKAAGRGLKGAIRRSVSWVMRHAGILWSRSKRAVSAIFDGARRYGRRLLPEARQLGSRLLQGAHSLGRRVVDSGRRAVQAGGRLLGRARDTVRSIARSAAERAGDLVRRARGVLGRIGGAVTGGVRSALEHARGLARRGGNLVRRALGRGQAVFQRIRQRVAELVQRGREFLQRTVRGAIEHGRHLLTAAKNRAVEVARNAYRRGREILSRGFSSAKNFVRRGIHWVRGRAIPWLTTKLRSLKERILNFLRDRWHHLKERAYRGLEKVGLRKPAIGHAKAWGNMSRAEQRAFQHSYSRHHAEFGLPNWSGRNAESLRQQYNAAVARVRENAQSITVRRRPVGVMGSGVPGSAQPVRHFEYTDPSGVRYYYYETLEGRFVSAGRY